MSARRRPRVLYLAFYFPPTRASGVFRSRATANHLAAAGWDVTVATAPREFFTRFIDSVDPSLEATVDPRVRVVRPRMGFYRWESDIRRFGWFRGTFPSLATKLHRWQTEQIFPEAYATWLPCLVAGAVADHVRRPYDLVVATGNPFASFAAAWALHRALRVPYVLDYRDAWTFNQFTEEVRFPVGHSAWRWEERVLGEAAEVAFVNDGMRGWHAQRYPAVASRMTVVANGWEPEILGDLPSPDPAVGRPLRVGYVGTVTDAMPIEELVEGWRRARRHPLLHDATLHVHGHLGFFPHHAPSLLSRMALHDGIGLTYEGSVEKARVGDVYASLDVLLLWLPGAQYVTSGKVFEYMATGRPIVSVHDAGIAAAEVLRGYPGWVPNRSLAPAHVADAIVAGARLAQDQDSERVRASREYASGWTREAVLAPFERRLRTFAGG